MTCSYCWMQHEGICWRIKSIEYFDDGVTIRKVELLPITDQPSYAGVFVNPKILPTLPANQSGETN